jgi:hypothetical protein
MISQAMMIDHLARGGKMISTIRRSSPPRSSIRLTHSSPPFRSSDSMPSYGCTTCGVVYATYAQLLEHGWQHEADDGPPSPMWLSVAMELGKRLPPSQMASASLSSYEKMEGTVEKII